MVDKLSKSIQELRVGTTRDEFATNYANLSGQKKNSSIWQKAYDEGKEYFKYFDFNNGSNGTIDETEISHVSYFQKIMNGTVKEFKSTIAEMLEGNTNSLVDTYKQHETKQASIEEKFKNTPEQKGLKPVVEMTDEEIKSEILKYETCVDFSQASRSKLEKMLEALRTKISLADKNSDIIDMHIGTFNQGQLGSCTLLSRISTLSDEEISKIVKKCEKNGKTYYEITFPIYYGTDTKVTVSEEELQQQSIEIENKGEKHSITGFSTGDKDVMLFEMAFIKQFGLNHFIEGVNIKNIVKIFEFPPTENSKTPSTSSNFEENLINGKYKVCNIRSIDTMKNHFSYDETFQSSSGLSAEFKLSKGNRFIALSSLRNLGHDTTELEQLSDKELMNILEKFVGAEGFGFIADLTLSNGIQINEAHALTLKSYNPETKTVILNNPAQNYVDISMPLDIAEKYFDFQ